MSNSTFTCAISLIASRRANDRLPMSKEVIRRPRHAIWPTSPCERDGRSDGMRIRRRLLMIEKLSAMLVRPYRKPWDGVLAKLMS